MEKKDPCILHFTYLNLDRAKHSHRDKVLPSSSLSSTFSHYLSVMGSRFMDQTAFLLLGDLDTRMKR